MLDRSRQTPAAAPAPRCRPSEVSDALASRLRKHTEGEVLFDAGSRGRYATDASIYQIMPVGVLVPRHERDIAAAIDIARDLKVPVLPRGGGTSQCGQATGAALVDRHHEALSPRARRRRAAAHRDGRAGPRARSPERAAEAARPVVPGRRVDQRAGDARRHGRQQLVRLALDRLRQHGAQRARRERMAVRRRAASSSARWRSSARARPTSQRSCATSRSEHRAQIEARWPKVMRRVGRLQPRHLPQPERAPVHRRTAASTSRTCWSAPKARSRSRAA